MTSTKQTTFKLLACSIACLVAYQKQRGIQYFLYGIWYLLCRVHFSLLTHFVPGLVENVARRCECGCAGVLAKRKSHTLKSGFNKFHCNALTVYTNIMKWFKILTLAHFLLALMPWLPQPRGSLNAEAFPLKVFWCSPSQIKLLALFRLIAPCGAKWP